MILLWGDTRDRVSSIAEPHTDGALSVSSELRIVLHVGHGRFIVIDADDSWTVRLLGSFLVYDWLLPNDIFQRGEVRLHPLYLALSLSDGRCIAIWRSGTHLRRCHGVQCYSRRVEVEVGRLVAHIYDASFNHGLFHIWNLRLIHLLASGRVHTILTEILKLPHAATSRRLRTYFFLFDSELLVDDRCSRVFVLRRRRSQLRRWNSLFFLFYHIDCQFFVHKGDVLLVLFLNWFRSTVKHGIIMSGL